MSQPVAHSLDLTLLPGELTVLRLPPGAPQPAIPAGGFLSVTRTPEELSIVCEAGRAPDGVPGEGPWRAFRVKGPIPFSMVGVLASLTGPLAAAEISIFAVSTYDTDYLLVHSEDLGRAQAVLSRRHRVV